MAAAFSMALNLSACFSAEENIDVVTYGPPSDMGYITSNDDDMIQEEDSIGETVPENETEEDPAVSDEEASDDEADTEETVSEEDEDTEGITEDE